MWNRVLSVGGDTEQLSRDSTVFRERVCVCVCARCLGKEENKRNVTAANQASYGTKPYILTVLFVTEEEVLPLHAASLPGRKAQTLCFGPSLKKKKRKKKSSYWRQPGEDFISCPLCELANWANRSLAKDHWMNFAWADCCDWDSRLLCDCKLSFGLGPSRGSLLLPNERYRLGT